MFFIKLMQNGEPIEVPVEMIIPRYLTAKKQLPLSAKMNVKTLKKMEKFQLSNAEHYEKTMKLVELNNFKLVAAVDYVLKDISDKELETFERLTVIPTAKDYILSSYNYNQALKCTDKHKGFSDSFLKEKLMPMFPGKKSLNKKYYKNLCSKLEEGIAEVQKQVGCGELTLEDMLTIAYME